MDKDAYYFPHFCNARHDRKIKRLRKELGTEGYGIFFMLLEVLREQIDFKYPYDDIDLLADEFETSVQKIEVVLNKYALFEFDELHKFFSPKLIVFLQPYLRQKEQRRLAGIESGKARKNKKESNKIERSLNESSTDVERMLNENEQSKVKESKVKESKRNERNESKESKKSDTKNKHTFFQNFYNDTIGQPIPTHFYKTCCSYLDDGMHEVVITQAILKGVDKEVPHLYIEKVLSDWFKNKKLKLADIQEQLTFKKPAKQVPSHANFEQRKYEEDEYEKFYANLQDVKTD